MSEKKTLFISDIHLSIDAPWAWFDVKKESQYLIDFFEYLKNRHTKKKDIKELVLLGDIFDLWVAPHDQPPHSFNQIIKDQKAVLAAIKNTANMVPMLYVNGNHDFRVDSFRLEKALGKKVKHIGDKYQRRNIKAEHGHRWALFNRPDSKNGGPEGLPLGYYISRLHASLGKTQKAKVNLVWQAIDETFQMMGPEKLPQSVFDAIKEAVETTHGKKVQDFDMGGVIGKVKFTDIRDRYKSLFEDWVNAKGYWFAVQMIMSELNRLGTVADKMCKDGTNIVVLGHSHDTKMDKDSLFVEDRIYANCGYWCGFGQPNKINDNAHFVETDGKTVSLLKFHNTSKTWQIEKSLSL